MSFQKGNVARKRSQKHQNQTSFKNNLHDKSPQIKMINSLQILGVCQRCKDVLEWKIKYKKYKPLTVPKKCTKCGQKSVKQAYHILCQECVESSQKCGKCGKENYLEKPAPSAAQVAAEQAAIQNEIAKLPERKRRTFFRYIAKGQDIKEPLENFSSFAQALDDLSDDSAADDNDDEDSDKSN